MRSVRRMALMWTTVLLTLVGLVGAGSAYLIDLSESGLLLDGQLRLIALNAGTGPALPTEQARGAGHPDDVLVQIWSDTGQLLSTSNPHLTLSRQHELGFASPTVAGEPWRSFQASDGRITVQAAQRVSVRTELAQTAALEAAVPILITIPLGWLVIGWWLQRITARLSGLAAEIATRGSESRTPIPVTEIPVEVSPLVVAMNVLIGRLQQSIERQKRFLSDAAHELRTPLAALRLQIENLQHERSEASIPELRRGAARASALVDQLLRLARYEAGALDVPVRPVDLAALVLDCVAEQVPLAESKGIDLGIGSSEPVVVRAVDRDLQLLIGNLIENAVRYTPAGGLVDVSVRRRGTAAEVEVADTGYGIKEEALPRVFDRFFRAAPQGIEGTGLGLAICRAIADRYGFTVSLRNRPDRRGLIATVVAPLQPAAVAR